MSSKSDSLQDIFGPTSGDSNGPDKLIREEGSEHTTASISANKVDDFDDIFVESGDASACVGAQTAGTKQEWPDDSSPGGPSGSSTTQVAVDQPSSLGSDDLDNIFGAPSSNPRGSTHPVKGVTGESLGVRDTEGTNADTKSAAVSPNSGQDSKSESASAAGRGTSSDGHKAFLDFLYDGDSTSAACQNVNDESPGADESASCADDNTKSDIGTSSLEGSDVSTQQAASSLEDTLASRDEVISNSGTGVNPHQGVKTRGGNDEVRPSVIAMLPDSSTRARLDAQSRSEDVAEEAFRSTRSRVVQRPLPADPVRALRELIGHDAASGEDGSADESKVTRADIIPGEVDAAMGAVEDVGYVRRLCVATGGFLPSELRPAVWSLLLGLGTTTPDDAAFREWREGQDRRKSGGDGGGTGGASSAGAVQNKIDLRNDSLALARRLCVGGDTAGTADGAASPGGAGAAGGGAWTSSEALATDIEQVLTFYCTRRSEAYEPVLSALVGPLFSLGLEAAAVSSMLYALVGALTLFLGRGLTLAVRDLAWAHTHRRLHDLCTYHDPQLVQHLDRCFPGWEMPLPAASVSRAETSARDQETAAMVDDLESSLGPSIARRRQSAGRGNPAQAFSQEQDDGDVSESREGGAVGMALRAGSSSESQGLVEPSLLVAACSGLGSTVPLERLVLLWDYLLVRRDKHFGFFLLLAVLLRRRDELLASTGTQLRRLLSEILSPEGMASAGFGDEGEKGDGPAKEGGGAEVARSVDTDCDSGMVFWCKEAEALDLATPESFRHHLALIGEIAEAEHEAAMRARSKVQGTDFSNAVPSTPSTVASTVTTSDEAGRTPSSASTSDGGSDGAAPVIKSDVSAGVASTEGTASTGEAEVSSAQAQHDASPARSTGQSSFLRMRSMMKNAGDKIAADLKNLKLTRTPSGSRRVPSSDNLAPPSELSLPQLCLAVSAKELVFRVSGRGRRVDDEEEEDVKEEVKEGGENEGGLFRGRRPLSFFAVDCRPKEQVEAGRLPTAYHLDPLSMENPEDMAETVMSVFEPLRGSTHLCLVGTGDGHIRSRGLAMQEAQGDAEKNSGDLGSLKAARDEYSYVNTCALFFVKRGFPYVSVLEGGYAAAHELVMDALSRNPAAAVANMEASPGGTTAQSAGNAALVAAIVDHNPAACRLCLAKNRGNNAPRSNGNNSNSSSNASNNNSNVLGSIVVAGVSFPVSPPIWARLGAADASSHNQDVTGETGEATRARNAQRRGSSHAGDRVTNVFFPPPNYRKIEQGSPNTSAGKTPPSKDDHVSVGDTGTQGTVEDGATGSVRIAGGLGAGGNAASLFKGGGMFRGMNVNMGMTVNNLFKGQPRSTDATSSSAIPPGTSTQASEDVQEGSKVNAASGTATASGSGPAGSVKTQTSADITSKLRLSFGRFSTSKDAKKDSDEGKSNTGNGQGGVEQKDSGFTSLFRKAQTFKPADVAAAFADLRDGPKSFGVSGSGVSSVAGGSAPSPSSSEPKPKAPRRSVGDDGEDDGEGLFVIGDDGSESSETPDSDFEGFDGEHRPPSGGGARSEADKALALLEHRLSGQVKGGTMVVDAFLKVPGAKMFTVTKHKVTYHDVDSSPAGENSEPGPSSTSQSSETETSVSTNNDSKKEYENRDDDAQASITAGSGDASTGGTKTDGTAKKESMRVRAVTELERLIFLSRERILVVACPDGPRNPGLVKSNHHLTELQKMTFMRRDPTLVTLHYLAGDEQEQSAEPESDESRVKEAPSTPETKRNVYRFAPDDKEAFIRIIRGALQRFQS